MAGVMRRSIEIDEESAAQEREAHTRLCTENKVAYDHTFFPNASLNMILPGPARNAGDLASQRLGARPAGRAAPGDPRVPDGRGRPRRGQGGLQRPRRRQRLRGVAQVRRRPARLRPRPAAAAVVRLVVRVLLHLAHHRHTRHVGGACVDPSCLLEEPFDRNLPFQDASSLNGAVQLLSSSEEDDDDEVTFNTIKRSAGRKIAEGLSGVAIACKPVVGNGHGKNGADDDHNDDGDVDKCNETTPVFNGDNGEGGEAKSSGEREAKSPMKDETAAKTEDALLKQDDATPSSS